MMIAHNNFASQLKDELMGSLGAGLVLGVLSYGGSKALEKYENSVLENVSDTFGNWARKKLLCCNGQNIVNVISFKSNTIWKADHNSIHIDAQDDKTLCDLFAKEKRLWIDNDHRKYAQIKHRLFHEYKHVHNSDRVKTQLCLLMTGIPMITAQSPYVFFLSGVFTVITQCIFGRYQETEADRYAFTKMSSEDIKKVEIDMQEEAQKFSDNLEKKMSLNKTMGLLAKFVYFLYQKCFISVQEIDQKKMWHKVTYFFLGSSRYPDWYARADSAKKYADQKYV